MQGHIDLEGGEVESHIERIDVALCARVEYRASPRFAGRMREPEVSFVADAQGTEAVLEADKRGGLMGDLFG